MCMSWRDVRGRGGCISELCVPPPAVLNAVYGLIFSKGFTEYGGREGHRKQPAGVGRWTSCQQGKGAGEACPRSQTGSPRVPAGQWDPPHLRPCPDCALHHTQRKIGTGLMGDVLYNLAPDNPATYISKQDMCFCCFAQLSCTSNSSRNVK